MRRGPIRRGFDVHAPLLSLPGHLSHRVSTAFRPKCPTWRPTARARGRAGARRLTGDDAALRVGINWQGNPKYRDDRYRSMPLAEFAPLAEVEGVRLFSLQKGSGSEQLAEATFASRRPGESSSTTRAGRFATRRP